jgi:hypothetical protein
VYDFRSLAEGIAIPYGLYDPNLNAGYVFVGTSADTSEFAVNAIAWWWKSFGQCQYPALWQGIGELTRDDEKSCGYPPVLCTVQACVHSV